MRIADDDGNQRRKSSASAAPCSFRLSNRLRSRGVSKMGTDAKVVGEANRCVESPLPVRDWTWSSPPLGVEVAAVDSPQHHDAAGTPSNATGVTSPIGRPGAATGGSCLRASRRLSS